MPFPHTYVPWTPPAKKPDTGGGAFAFSLLWFVLVVVVVAILFATSADHHAKARASWRLYASTHSCRFLYTRERSAYLSSVTESCYVCDDAAVHCTEDP